MAKLVVDLQRGLIEVEAEDEFVRRVYADVKDSVMRRLADTATRGTATEDIQDDVGAETQGAKKLRRRTRSGGPSCASRIEAVKEEGFFKEPQAAGDVRAKLKEKGTTYDSKNVAAALNNLTKAGKLRRFNENGWKYQNP